MKERSETRHDAGTPRDGRSDCLDEAEILAVANGETIARGAAALAEHLDECPKCLELVAHATRLASTSPLPDASAATPARSLDVTPAADRYVLHHEIARGGMGRIFAATDTMLGRTVAIKCVRDDAGHLDARFEREVKLTASLQHPAIVPIHDAGRLPDGRLFYAM